MDSLDKMVVEDSEKFQISMKNNTDKHTKTENAVEKAMNLTSSVIDNEILIGRFKELVDKELELGEKILFGVRQSYVHDLAPKVIVATNKKLIVIKPSFLYHYFGFNVFTPTFSELIHYNRISHVIRFRGKVLNSINLTVIGHGDVKIGGLSDLSAKKLFTYIDKVVEELET
ncbi:MAG: PH domain-containing protein [Candidatus Marsarchaeota archaeon]|nr:PH domain-containing protein [Candidatus Marsarchaeota archaeon]